MFTGDRSGDFLYPALHAAGFASQPSSTSLHDGLNLHDIAITAAAHCAPPPHPPPPDELAHCSTHLRDTLAAMPNLQALIALGSIAFDACLALLRSLNLATFKPRPRFAHGLLLTPPSSPFLLASYHPSQQNTFTGVLTMPMLVKLLTTARDQLQRDEGPGSRA
jgi:uracil-DNA glycosylase